MACSIPSSPRANNREALDDYYRFSALADYKTHRASVDERHTEGVVNNFERIMLVDDLGYRDLLA
jgi:hypothetical protein